MCGVAMPLIVRMQMKTNRSAPLAANIAPEKLQILTTEEKQLKRERYRPPPCPTLGLVAKKAVPLAMRIAASITFWIMVSFHLMIRFWAATQQ